MVTAGEINWSFGPSVCDMKYQLGCRTVVDAETSQRNRRRSFSTQDGNCGQGLGPGSTKNTLDDSEGNRNLTEKPPPHPVCDMNLTRGRVRTNHLKKSSIGDRAHERTLKPRSYPTHERPRPRMSTVLSRNILFRFDRL